jgi:hypothetical protein
MRIWILAVATVAVLIGVAGGSYWYGNHSSDKPILVSNAPSAASEGIKVHGDWEITVFDPHTDEEMVYAFSNELADTGSAVLAWALQGQGIVRVNDTFDNGMRLSGLGTNNWKIGLHEKYAPAYPNPPPNFNSKSLCSSQSGKMHNSFGKKPTGDYYAPMLTTRVVKSGVGLDEVSAFELAGTCEIGKNATIAGVSTESRLASNLTTESGEDYFHPAWTDLVTQEGCISINSLLPYGCTSGHGSESTANPRFTEKVLDTPIPVKEGQTINVVVRISFE